MASTAPTATASADPLNLTPPDPVSQIGLALPTLLLYEVSILAVRHIEKQREKRAAQEAAA